MDNGTEDDRCLLNSSNRTGSSLRSFSASWLARWLLDAEGGEGMTNALQPGRLVRWQFGNGRQMQLTGRVSDLKSNLVVVEANGVTYEFRPQELQVVPTCAWCGEELTGRPSLLAKQRYCSVECRYEDLHADYDGWVFQTIVDFKTEHDGWSPSLPMIAKTTGLAQKTVERSLRRLVKAGRIKVIGNGRYQGFVVAGGRWVYQEPTA